MPDPSPALWKHRSIEAATGAVSSAEWRAQGVSIDTRTLQPGDLFVALPGEESNGHDYVEQAFNKGASAALISKQPKTLAHFGPVACVRNTETALRKLAEYRRKETQAKFIAVTGSVGKTSVKDMLRHCLTAQAPTHATVGNLNNHLGLPLSLARMPVNSSYGVFELGMNHSGEIRKLTRVVQPHVAIITAVTPVHLEFFKSVEDIARAKAEIMESLPQNGTVILPADSPYFSILQQQAKRLGIQNIWTFGESETADFRLLNITPTATGQRLTIRTPDGNLRVMLHVIGQHHAVNSLAVLAGIKALGASVNKAIEQLESWQPVSGRGTLHELTLPSGASILLINDSYNASPTSMRAAFGILQTLKEQRPERRALAVLGDM
ncbi:MAG: UDP-N-acetylmuramoyl-tripeptide--D-alanyl-D-alanine ligase, partial [Rickettsiales bacterium]|nr:UDP-N-acetylmuramoyl-tripeptide--D-alanyl-D-alanine ligase [Rickettsiales bacterium]